MTLHLTSDDEQITGRIPSVRIVAWEAEGRAAFAAGVSAHDCPHVAGEPVYVWERGWFRAAEVRDISLLRAALEMRDGADRVLSDGFHRLVDAGMPWPEIVLQSGRSPQEIRRLWDDVRGVDLVGQWTPAATQESGPTRASKGANP